MYLVISEPNVCGDYFISKFDNLEEAIICYNKDKKELVEDPDAICVAGDKVMRYSTVYLVTILEQTEKYPYKINMDSYMTEVVGRNPNNPNKYLDVGCRATHIPTGETAISIGWGSFKDNTKTAIGDIISKLLKQGKSDLI